MNLIRFPPPQIQRPRKQLQQSSSSAADEPAQVTMTNMSVATRVRNVLDVVHSSGDYERSVDVTSYLPYIFIF